MIPASPCPLCGATAPRFHADRRRPYHRCPVCSLIHVPPSHHPDATAERAQYDLHENDPADPGYRRFLSRAEAAVIERVQPPACGLDFGSGPGPTLSIMLGERGYEMSIFDPFYAPDEQVFAHRYDFISATEVFEHLYRPAGELRRLLECLVPGGWLVVMTGRPYGDDESFARWNYTHDPTHVAFFATATFTWIAREYDLHLDIVGPDVVALRTPA